MRQFNFLLELLPWLLVGYLKIVAIDAGGIGLAQKYAALAHTYGETTKKLIIIEKRLAEQCQEIADLIADRERKKSALSVYLATKSNVYIAELLVLNARKRLCVTELEYFGTKSDLVGLEKIMANVVAYDEHIYRSYR